MTTSPVKLGVIGLSAGGSWASRAHLPYFQKTTNYEIVALQNSSRESAEKAADKYGLTTAACYGNFNDLVDDPNVDTVAVIVKVTEHYAIIEAALRAKKDVFTEWPVARNLKEAEQLTALATQAGVRTLVGLQGRQDPAVRMAKQMVEAGNLGEILGTTMIGYGFSLASTLPAERDYMLPIENGINLLTIAVGHSMDALCYVLGELKDLQASLGNMRPKMPLTDKDGNVVAVSEKTSHDFVSVTGHLQRGGGVATIAYQSGMCQTGRGFTWEINGTNGTLLLEADNGFVQIAHPTIKYVKAEKDAKLENIEIPIANELAVNVSNTWDAWTGNGDGCVVTLQDALVRHRMIDAIYRSNEQGTRETYI
ncbi:transcription regulator gal80 [Xylographa trunciseda]|nr:transcription regulator gal80 [Xylographa trunciseda]